MYAYCPRACGWKFPISANPQDMQHETAIDAHMVEAHGASAVVPPEMPTPDL